jgi:hypothetical protein
MQINKPNNNRKTRRSEDQRREYAVKRAEAARRPGVRVSEKSDKAVTADEKIKAAVKSVSKEDAIIDLYEDPFKKTKAEEDLVINIDFTKPIEILGKIARQIIKLLRVAQSKISAIDWSEVKSLRPKDAIKSRKSMAVSAGTLVVVFFLGINILNMFSSSAPNISTTSVMGDTSNAIQLDAKPTFGILYPNNKDRGSYNSVAKISPPGTPDAFAYVDRIEGVEVQVTQQELPDRFKTNQEQEFKEFALNFAATVEAKGDDFTAYIGTSAQGPQSVVAIKDNLLILIKSTTGVSPDSWSKYIDSLEQ